MENKFTSDINHFIKKAKDRVRAFDRDNQRFIEDILLKEIIVAMVKFYKKI